MNKKYPKNYESMQLSEIKKEFETTLLETNRTYQFFIDLKNIGEIDETTKKLLNEMKPLLLKGKENVKKFDSTFEQLLMTKPQIVSVFPLLLMLSKSERKNLKKSTKLKIFNFKDNHISMDEYSFKDKKDMVLSLEEINAYRVFFKETGLKTIFTEKIDNSIVDYVTGALAGLDSHGRKNRGGKIFEKMCQEVIEKICFNNNLQIELFNQFEFYKLEKLGIKVPISMRKKKADFILYDKNIQKVVNIEVNFFNEKGSKPNAILGDYENRKRKLNEYGIEFIQITDGKCWGNGVITEETFEELNLMNFSMAKDGYLEEILKKIFKE